MIHLIIFIATIVDMLIWIIFIVIVKIAIERGASSMQRISGKDNK